ncbi:DUF2586 family protein [Chryseolinea sp. T2]|uniref:DUF2586 family protein n=1 Tax=Chryseolinea sp. T2 TaxID=3129255 RepID=UPI003077F78D
MALSKITITEINGASRFLTSDDSKSGMLFYVSDTSALAETSFQVYSLQEAETAGVTVDDFPVAHYHIDEFYRMSDSAQLQVKFVSYTGGTHDFAEVKELVADADGDMSQIGVYTQANFSTGMVTALQAVMSDLKEEDDIPLVSLLQANFSGVTLSSLSDLSSSNAPQVAVLLGQDGGGTGAALYNSIGKSIGILGAALGSLSVSSVHESIAWKGQYDVSGAELNTLAFANGTPYKSVSKSQLATLNDKKYIFLLKDFGLNGSYFNSSFVATQESSDYYSLERGRVINKSRKLLRTSLLPQLNSPLYLEESGSLRLETIGKFTSLAEQGLQGMLRAGELSNYSVYIDPAQDVLASDTLVIDVKLQPVGVSRYINITLGFAVSLA